MAYLFYTSYISVDLAHHKIFHAKVGKKAIKNLNIFEAESFKSCIFITT